VAKSVYFPSAGEPGYIMIRQIDIPKVKKHFFFVYPISSWLFIYLKITQFSLIPLLRLFCQYQLFSSFCLSLVCQLFVYLAYPQPFIYLCLVTLFSISPTLSPLSNLTVRRLLSFYAFVFLSSAQHFFLKFFSVLSYLPFPKPSIYLTSY
jgi:hypothetical protein